MAHLIENDGRVYQALSSYANMLGGFPGNAAIAKQLGYKNPQSVMESLRRLQNAGYIEIDGARQIKSILLVRSGLTLKARPAAKFFNKPRPPKTLSPKAKHPIAKKVPSQPRDGVDE